MNKVKEYIKNHGMKTVWFSKETGVHVATLRSYLCGQKKLTDRQAVKIYLFLRKLGADIDFLEIMYPYGVGIIIEKHSKEKKKNSKKQNTEGDQNQKDDETAHGKNHQCNLT